MKPSPPRVVSTPICLCSPVIAWVIATLIATFIATGVSAQDTGPTGGEPVPPPTNIRLTAPDHPLEWKSIDERLFVSSLGRHWLVQVQETAPGRVISSLGERDLRQTRIRIAIETDTGEQDLAFVQHLDNNRVEILLPGDPRLTAPPVVRQDLEDPWPNGCGIAVIDPGGTLDLNRNDRIELVLRPHATTGDRSASGLLLVEEDEEGIPRFVKPAEYVGTVKFADAYLTEIHWPKGSRFPHLDARLRPLADCRFLAQLQIRGVPECDNCCDIPVLLYPGDEGVFHPVYVTEIQKPFLERLRGDITLVSRGPDEEPLNSAEEAALSRAAAFFYLTGSGKETRVQLLKMLGERADLYRSQLLLDRLEEYFLLDPDQP